MPQPELPPIKAPILPDGFTAKVAALDRGIYERGLALDPVKLLSLGKDRFEKLLAADREARQPRDVRAYELTSFPQVQHGLFAFECAQVPPRKTSEQLTGQGQDGDAVRRIADWRDLWKASDPETIGKAYAFHDLFVSLCFGQSILEKVSDGRLRSPFLCGGRGPKVDLFRDWLAGQGPLVCVTLSQPLVRLFAWLADERAELPRALDLARAWFNLRVPSETQVRLAQAVLDGYLLGYHEDWPLWEYVGKATRSAPDRGRLAAWRKELAAQVPRIGGWQAEVRVAFYRQVGFDWESHLEFEPGKYRAFLARLSQTLLDQAGALLALGIAETATVAARFQDRVFVEAGKELRPEIGSLQQAAFPNSKFQVGFSEVQS